MIAVLGLKGKSASKKEPRRDGLYVVVQHVPAAEPPTFAGKPRPRDEALTIFAGVLRHAPQDFFHPHSGASIRVIAVDEWNRARLTAALLES